jgi:hypothetical protein
VRLRAPANSVRNSLILLPPPRASGTALALEAVELRYLWQPRIDPKFRVDQLRLATGKGSLLLDVRMIENGQGVIDAICGKLG